MSLFSSIEKSIEHGFQHWTQKLFGAAEANELMLMHRAILTDVESKIETMARGRRVFPYAHVRVLLVSEDANRRAMLETAFGERLETDIREALVSAACDIPLGFAVDVRAREAGPAPWVVDYAVPPPKVAEAPPEALAAPARLTVIKGSTGIAEYTLDKARTNIGRLAELTDAEHRVIRRNDIVFEDSADEASSTVSRRHAHIRHEGGEYRVCDDESEFGTRVFRDGRAIEVPPGNRRGEKLRPGDEIYLGRACLRFLVGQAILPAAGFQPATTHEECAVQVTENSAAGIHNLKAVSGGPASPEPSASAASKADQAPESPHSPAPAAP